MRRELRMSQRVIDEAYAIAREQIAYCRAHGHSPDAPSLRELLRAAGCRTTMRRGEEALYEAWLAAAWIALDSKRTARFIAESDDRLASRRAA